MYALLVENTAAVDLADTGGWPQLPAVVLRPIPACIGRADVHLCAVDPWEVSRKCLELKSDDASADQQSPSLDFICVCQAVTHVSADGVRLAAMRGDALRLQLGDSIRLPSHVRIRLVRLGFETAGEPAVQHQRQQKYGTDACTNTAVKFVAHAAVDATTVPAAPVAAQPASTSTRAATVAQPRSSRVKRERPRPDLPPVLDDTRPEPSMSPGAATAASTTDDDAGESDLLAAPPAAMPRPARHRSGSRRPSEGSGPPASVPPAGSIGQALDDLIGNLDGSLQPAARLLPRAEEFGGAESTPTAAPPARAQTRGPGGDAHAPTTSAERRVLLRAALGPNSLPEDDSPGLEAVQTLGGADFDPRRGRQTNAPESQAVFYAHDDMLLPGPAGADGGK